MALFAIRVGHVVHHILSLRITKRLGRTQICQQSELIESTLKERRKKRGEKGEEKKERRKRKGEKGKKKKERRKRKGEICSLYPVLCRNSDVMMM